MVNGMNRLNRIHGMVLRLLIIAGDREAIQKGGKGGGKGWNFKGKGGKGKYKGGPSYWDDAWPPTSATEGGAAGNSSAPRDASAGIEVAATAGSFELPPQAASAEPASAAASAEPASAAALAEPAPASAAEVVDVDAPGPAASAVAATSAEPRLEEAVPFAPVSATLPVAAAAAAAVPDCRRDGHGRRKYHSEPSRTRVAYDIDIDSSDDDRWPRSRRVKLVRRHRRSDSRFTMRSRTRSRSHGRRRHRSH